MKRLFATPWPWLALAAAAFVVLAAADLQGIEKLTGSTLLTLWLAFVATRCALDFTQMAASGRFDIEATISASISAGSAFFCVWIIMP
jgi:hypothetical protein